MLLQSSFGQPILVPPYHYDHRTSPRYPFQKPVTGFLAPIRSMQLYRAALGAAQGAKVRNLSGQRQGNPPGGSRLSSGWKTAQPCGMHFGRGNQVAIKDMEL